MADFIEAREDKPAVQVYKELLLASHFRERSFLSLLTRYSIT